MSTTYSRAVVHQPETRSAPCGRLLNWPRLLMWPTRTACTSTWTARAPANAVASLGGDVRGAIELDVLTFGATKNGALLGEAVVRLRPVAVVQCEVRAEAGDAAVQQATYIARGSGAADRYLWLTLAGHANAMARRLVDAVRDVPGVTLQPRAVANSPSSSGSEATPLRSCRAGRRSRLWMPSARSDGRRLGRHRGRRRCLRRRVRDVAAQPLSTASCWTARLCRQWPQQQRAERNPTASSRSGRSTSNHLLVLVPAEEQGTRPPMHQSIDPQTEHPNREKLVSRSPAEGRLFMPCGAERWTVRERRSNPLGLG